MIHTFPTLYPAMVIHRPSKVIKSPYVADIRLKDGTMALCHTPGLGCCGMVSSGRTIYVSRATNPKAKTAYTAQIADCEDIEGLYYVGIHPMVSQGIAGKLLHRIHPEAVWTSEVVVDTHTRLDFRGITPEGKTLYVEVKNAMISRHNLNKNEEDPNDLRMIRNALFPEGTRVSRAVSFSPRAVKHAETLAALAQLPDTECYLLYIVPRHDCEGLEINPHDRVYTHAVQRAIQQGVQVRVFGLHVEKEGITFERELAFYV